VRLMAWGNAFWHASTKIVELVAHLNQPNLVEARCYFDAHPQNAQRLVVLRSSNFLKADRITNVLTVSATYDMIFDKSKVFCCYQNDKTSRY
jgi:hypothetical protein